MKEPHGYYCLIQYCPSLSRLEAANVGVLLFVPERGILLTRTTRDHRRIQQFFGPGHDWQRIDAARRALESLLKLESPNLSRLPDLERFISQQANQLQITPPRWTRVTDPEQDLNRLFAELVEVPADSAPAVETTANPALQIQETATPRQPIA